MELTRERIDELTVLAQQLVIAHEPPYLTAERVLHFSFLRDAALQVEAMREAIGRAVDDLDTWLFVTSNKNDRITATVRRVRADLEGVIKSQSLNPKNEEGS
jgi:hypothetical protein